MTIFRPKNGLVLGQNGHKPYFDRDTKGSKQKTRILEKKENVINAEIDEKISQWPFLGCF